MTKGGIIIRFIDIGLIVLFGFLMISDIEIFSHIKMPGSEDMQIPPDEQEMTLLMVLINQSNQFRILDADSRVLTGFMSSPEELEIALQEAREQYGRAGTSVVVLIDPDPLSTVQSTVSVMDVCDRLGIPKNINADELKL